MAYKNRNEDKWVNYLLKNENRVRSRLNLYLLTENEDASDNLGVTTSKSGRETENNLIRKITNKNYIFRKRCLQCLEDYFNECSHLEQEIWTLHYRTGYSPERVGYEVHYSKSTVYSYLKAIKTELSLRIRKIEQEVYHVDD